MRILNVSLILVLSRTEYEGRRTFEGNSTDYVFGKEPYNIPCREDQRGTPTGVYGETKLHGEQAIAQSGVKALIFRTAWLYSELRR